MNNRLLLILIGSVYLTLAFISYQLNRISTLEERATEKDDKSAITTFSSENCMIEIGDGINWRPLILIHSSDDKETFSNQIPLDAKFVRIKCGTIIRNNRFSYEEIK